MRVFWLFWRNAVFVFGLPVYVLYGWSLYNSVDFDGDTLILFYKKPVYKKLGATRPKN